MDNLAHPFAPRIPSVLTETHDGPAAPPGTGRFARADLERGPCRPLSGEGRWANAALYLFDHGGVTWAVKDFRPRSWLVRQVVGRWMVRREANGLRKLDGVPGTPQGVFRVDAFAFAYRFVPGRSLKEMPADALGPEFFPTLERNVIAMHARARLVHLDLRNARNILVTAGGEPSMLDFQTHFNVRWMPGPLRRFAERVDLAAIYKHWATRSPDTLGPERADLLGWINKLRPLWVKRGYRYTGLPGAGRRKP
jgi:hypothetical protein